MPELNEGQAAERLTTPIDSDRYESVFSMDPEQFTSDLGPEEIWGPIDDGEEDSEESYLDVETDDDEYKVLPSSVSSHSKA